MAGRTPKLVNLSDSSAALADPATDVRGRRLCDAHGVKVGWVDDLLVDERERRVRFLHVAAGGFLGMGQTRLLIPVDAVARVEDDAVHVNHSRAHIVSAPAYRPGMAEELYLSDVYRFYGLVPYWHAADAGPSSSPFRA